MQRILRICFAATLVAVASAALPASDQSYVKRGEPRREGRAWVEYSDCSLPVRDGGRLVLRADFGSITSRLGPSGQLGCQVRLEAYTGDIGQARRFFKTYDLSLRQGEGTVYLTARSVYERRHHVQLSAEFHLSTPTRFNLDLGTQGGDISVEALDGELRASTAGGDIRTGDVAGPVKLETSGGNITLGNIGGRTEANTAGGTIRVGDVKGNASLDTSGGEIITGIIDGSANAQTAGGDILLRGASGPVVVLTAGGQIQIGDCGSTVRAETAGGNIRLQGARGMVRAQTSGGSIDLFQLQSAVRATTSAGRILAEISAKRDTFANSQLETSVGDVQVFLPVDLALNIDAVIEEPAGHKILSDFPQLQVKPATGEEDFGTRTVRAKCALNGGGRVLTIHTSMGNIEIHKINSQMLNQLRMRQELYWNTWQAREQRRVERELQKWQQKQQEDIQRIQEEMRRQQEELQKQLQQTDEPEQ